MSAQHVLHRVRTAVRRPPAVTSTVRPAVAPATTGEGWRRALRLGMIAYVVSRICAIAGAAVVAAQVRVADNVARHEALDNGELYDKPVLPGGARLITNVFTSWDGRWYLEIVRGGYPKVVPPDITFDQLEARTAFFPLFPTLVRIVNPIIPGGDTMAALFVNLLLGAAVIVLTGWLARSWWGDKVAGRAMVLMAVFPASVVLTMAYSEALLLALAAGCLLALDRRRWALAGVLASLGTAARPNGVALCAACAVAAAIAIYQRREWRSLIAPVLSPLGFIGFQLWVGWHANERGVWARVQREAWEEGTSFGLTALRRSWDAFRHPLSSPTDTVTALTVLTMVALLATMWRRRPSLPAVAYSAIVLTLMLAPSTVTARPRFLYTAFPLVLCFAAWWESSSWLQRVLHGDRDGNAWALFVGLNCAGLAALTALYGVYGVIP
jgi:glycosyl transferase family 87